jgi:catechol 2,3-dioxygenase-like lactoylglutathione lyase family enzyme
MAIKGLHAMFFTPMAEETRAFLRDKLGFPFIDTGDGWLVFKSPAAEIGCHPAQNSYHEFSFYCDNIHQTMAELRERGVEFTQEVVEQEWGFETRFRLPGGQEIDLFQPKYQI